MVDVDGDCISDLFMTVKNGGSTYYEIYLRRERLLLEADARQEIQKSNSTAGSQALKGMNSYCLVAREVISEDS
jgi:hypothetical protein